MPSVTIQLKDTNAHELWEIIRGNIASALATSSENFPSPNMAPSGADLLITAFGDNAGVICIGDSSVASTDSPGGILNGESQFFPGNLSFAGIYALATSANDKLRFEWKAARP